MSLLSSFMGGAAGATAEQAAMIAKRNAMKKGKSSEQQRCIDFFFEVASNNGCCGCLGKNKDMTMEEYQQLVQSKLQGYNFRQKAIAKIGLDESQIQEIPPIVLASYRFSDDDCLIRVNSETAVSSKYAVTWIFFSAVQMYTYTFIFDMTSDDTREITRDFFYSDITCFRTERQIKENIEVNMSQGCINSKENIVKNHYVVDMLEIIVPGTSYEFYLRNSNTVEQSIQAAKNMLREKKYSK